MRGVCCRRDVVFINNSKLDYPIRDISGSREDVYLSDREGNYSRSYLSEDGKGHYIPPTSDSGQRLIKLDRKRIGTPCRAMRAAEWPFEAHAADYKSLSLSPWLSRI